ncbi:MAG: KpsF/GutQ family sugar-phosphate isomerase [Wenyingzhuangia sp.]|uniref:KpsF/GutQ family sugar-phosphate isomerase n=1 Tax=Wenyingzhuangia sp. TaxID=1964193 RepID=UPI00321ACBA9
MTNNILTIAKKTIDLESKAIAHLSKLIDSNFEKAVTCILNTKGRVIITGIGKSATIATKIVATLNSTGTPAIFMHAADAIHGDLGVIQKDDVVICISKSGNTPEIKVLIPFIKKNNNPIIAITGNIESFLGLQADYTLNTYVEKEACPNNLAPTTSTTAQLVMGDALSVTLLELKKFSNHDFAKYHPGGALGKRLYLRVSDLVEKNNAPKVYTNTNIKDTLLEISDKRLGATVVLDQKELVGFITDGDIRRMLNNSDDFLSLTAKDIMSTKPKVIQYDAMAIEALQIMEDHNISQLIAIDKKDSYKGIIHLHDLMKEGVF